MVKYGWERAAAGVRFPVVVLAEGVVSFPRLTQWGGADSAPSSVTLSYENENVQLTTYQDQMWGDLSPWTDLTAFVEDSFGFVWESENLVEPPNSTDVRVQGADISTSADVSCRTFHPLPEEVGLEGKTKRNQAAMDADHRRIELPCGDSGEETLVVGEADKWAAGLQITVEKTPLCVLLMGGNVSIDSLKLGIVDDLLRHLRAG